MGQKSTRVSDNQEYITSERWKCEKSPSGAHHWIIDCGQMTCTYCNYSKDINANLFGWSKPEVKQDSSIQPEK